MCVRSKFVYECFLNLESKSESDEDVVWHEDPSTGTNKNDKYFTLLLKYWYMSSPENIYIVYEIHGTM